MATIPRPLTVFGSSAFSPQAPRSSRSSRKNNDPGDEQEGFIPPAATWYDEANEHFVALLEGTTSVPSSKSADILDSSEIFYFQTVSMPSNHRSSSSSQIPSVHELHGFEAAKEAFQREELKHTLFLSKMYPVMLPYRYARRVPNNNTEKHHEIRIPKLVKFSLDGTLLALQLSPSVLRIIQVEEYDGSSKTTTESSSSTSNHRPLQWTINLANNSHHPTAATPSASPSGLIPTGSITTSDATTSSSSTPSPTSILPGGVLWSNHGGNSQDLILITTTAVLFYKVSITRNQLAKSRAYAHAADVYWFEPRTRALLVGTFFGNEAKTTGSNESLFMRTYFLRMAESDEAFSSSGSGGGGRLSTATGGYYLPRLELPPPDVLPLFELGGSSSGDGGMRKELEMNDVALVNMYGEAYCIELKCGKKGDAVNVYHLDKVRRRVYLETTLRRIGKGPFLIMVLDNVLCIHCTGSKTSCLYDIADSTVQSGGDPIYHGGFIFDSKSQSFHNEIYDGRYTILPPKFLLDPEGHGLIYSPELDLPLITSSTPLSTCIVPFLLRRESPPYVSHTIALQRFYTMIQIKDSSSLSQSSFLPTVASAYNEDALLYDMECCLPLIFRAALLPSSYASSSTYFDASNDSSICSLPPPSCASSITQIEILEKVLLPHASLSIRQSNIAQLEFVATTCRRYMETLETAAIPSCPALECLVVALLWRLGRGDQVMRLLKARRKRILEVRQLQPGSSNSKGDGSDVEGMEDMERVGILAFADMLLAIASEVPLGIGVQTSDETSQPTKYQTQYANSFTNLAIDLMCSTSSYHIVAKHLLELNRVMDAITVCTHGISSVYYSSNNNKSASTTTFRNNNNAGPSSPPFSRKGTRAVDFFCAAIASAELMPGLGDRCKLFYHLRSFLSRWDPDCFSFDTKSTTMMMTDVEQQRPFSSGQQQTITVPQSALADQFPNFPDHLFGSGGKTNPTSLKVREMFGYPKRSVIVSRTSMG